MRKQDTVRSDETEPAGRWMILGGRGSNPRDTVRRLVLLALVLAPMVLAGLLGCYWLKDNLPEWVFWKAGLVFVIGLEGAYGLVLAGLAIALPTLAVLLVRARRRGIRRPALARWLLLCCSVLLSLGMTEGSVLVWRTLAQRSAGLPQALLMRPHPLDLGRMLSKTLPKLPEQFDASPDGEINLVILGESSAEGVPYNLSGLSLGTIVAWQLEQLFPARRFHVEGLALSGDTLEKQHEKLAELTRRPDVLIVYCGHNEFSARIPWVRDRAYYIDASKPTTWSRFVRRAERASPLCGLLAELADKCRIGIPPPRSGHRALIDVPVYSPSDLAALLADFERRLEAIVADAERVGALPILIAPPANDSGFEPNRSFLPPETPRAERVAFAWEFHAARELEQTDSEQSLTRYRALLARQPGFAETHYRLARLLERQAAWDEAYRHAVLARDFDGYPMRALTAFQEIYHKVAARHRCLLIDGQDYFHRIGHHGLLDEHLFHDGMHPALRGQIALAQAVLEGLRQVRAFDWPEPTPAPVIEPARCADHFGLNAQEWRRIAAWGAMFYDLTAPMRYDGSERQARKRAFLTATDALDAGKLPEALGLPALGVPAPVPIIPQAVLGSTGAAPPPERRQPLALPAASAEPNSPRGSEHGHD